MMLKVTINILSLQINIFPKNTKTKTYKQILKALSFSCKVNITKKTIYQQTIKFHLLIVLSELTFIILLNCIQTSEVTYGNAG